MCQSIFCFLSKYFCSRCLKKYSWYLCVIFFAVLLLFLIKEFIFNSSIDKSAYASLITGLVAVLAAFTAYFSTVEQSKLQNRFKQYELQRSVYISTGTIAAKLISIKNSTEYFIDRINNAVDGNQNKVVREEKIINEILSGIKIDDLCDVVKESIGINHELYWEIFALSSEIKKELLSLRLTFDHNKEISIKTINRLLSKNNSTLDEVIQKIKLYTQQLKLESLLYLKKSS